MWILIDNYDSFTYILHHYLLQTGNDCKVYRNDEISLDELIKLNPSRIIISPGPETPRQSGICMDMIDQFHKKIPILGICLGHQALGIYFGASLKKLSYPMHGKTSEMIHNEHKIFEKIPNKFTAMRYHSLYIDEFENTELEAIAYSNDDKITMALTHKKYPCIGIQFHPESIGTNDGLQILKNWGGMF